MRDNFTPAEIAAGGISADEADPNRNARANLLEYALGAPPARASDPALYLRTQVVLDPGDGKFHARLVYRERKNDPRLVFQPEVSGDRTSWQGGNAAVEEIGRTAINDAFDEVTVQDRTAAEPGAPRYFRLRVVRNEEGPR
jgi:hypothetical protein